MQFNSQCYDNMPYINSELKELVREKHKLKKVFDKYPYTYGTMLQRN